MQKAPSNLFVGAFCFTKRNTDDTDASQSKRRTVQIFADFLWVHKVTQTKLFDYQFRRYDIQVTIL